MDVEIEDAQCAAALAAVLGHDAPFAEAELATVGELEVRHARSLEGLGACTGLTQLRLIGCELADLLVLESMAQLQELALEGCVVESFTGPSFCDQLGRVDLLFTSIADAGDLLGIGPWRRGSILGNPWAPTGYAALVAASNDGRAIELATEPDCKAARALWEALGAVCGAIGGREVVVRPGVPSLTTNAVDVLEIPVSAVRHELRQAGITLEALFSERPGRVLGDDLAELARAREIGDAGDAKRWIAAAALSGEERAALERFVDRFAAALFWRASASLVARHADALGVTLPAWYAELRACLDGWIPHRISAPVRFDGFAGPSPRAARVATRTFDLGMRESSADLADALRAAGTLPIGVCVEDPEHMLAIRLTGDDRAVYDYHEDDLRDVVRAGRAVDTSLSRVFSSYAEMLSHVVEITGYEE